MVHRPKKKKKAAKRRTVPGCHTIKDDEAEAFLKDQLLLSTMEEKRERSLAAIDDDDVSVMVSIGAPVSFAKQKYIAHIYRVDNCEKEEHNGWLIHLWYPNLVWGNHPTYRAYIAKMSDELGQDLRQVGV